VGQPSLQATRATDGHIRGVEATSGGLLRSTLIATGAAVAVLTVFTCRSNMAWTRPVLAASLARRKWV
jgi:hypothetical protein